MIETKNKVVQKIAQRVETSKKLPSLTLLRGGVGGKIDTQNTDHIKLSDQSIQLLFQLLKDLQVVVVDEGWGPVSPQEEGTRSTKDITKRRKSMTTAEWLLERGGAIVTLHHHRGG